MKHGPQDDPGAGPGHAGSCAGERHGWHEPLPLSLPKPTIWPLVLALGACLLAWGILTSWAISLLGLVLFATGLGGWIARMRDEWNP